MLHRRARARAAEVVLTDQGLPGCSGIEALVGLRKAFPRVTAVVVSATDDRGSVNSALQAGAAGFMIKTSKAGVMVAALQLIAYLPPDYAAQLKPAIAANWQQILTKQQRTP